MLDDPGVACLLVASRLNSSSARSRAVDGHNARLSNTLPASPLHNLSAVLLACSQQLYPETDLQYVEVYRATMIHNIQKVFMLCSRGLLNREFYFGNVNGSV